MQSGSLRMRNDPGIIQGFLLYDVSTLIKNLGATFEKEGTMPDEEQTNQNAPGTVLAAPTRLPNGIIGAKEIPIPTPPVVTTINRHQSLLAVLEEQVEMLRIRLIPMLSDHGESDIPPLMEKEIAGASTITANVAEATNTADRISAKIMQLLQNLEV